MNQILVTNLRFSKKSKIIIIFKIQLMFSIVLILFLLFHYIYSIYSIYKKEKLSATLLNNFRLESIYSNNYTVVQLNNSESFSVIGIIKIEKINLKYPILSKTSDDLLKISPCKFFGPLPNQKGNLCIAAHNYDDDRFFSSINRLELNDSINIYDSNRYFYNLLCLFKI